MAMNNYDAFLEGIQYSDLDKLKKYLNKDNINLPIKLSNVLPIYNAFQTQDPIIVKYFLDLGAKVNIGCTRGNFTYNSPVEFIVYEAIDMYREFDDILNMKEIIKLLYDYGSDLNIRNKNGETPLDIAIRYLCKELEDFLKNLGAKTSIELDKGNNISV